MVSMMQIYNHARGSKMRYLKILSVSKNSSKLLVFLSVLWLGHNSAAAQNCLLSAEGDGDNISSYRERGDRCEGVYRQKVSGRVNLRVVGYHSNRLDADDLSSTTPVIVKVIGDHNINKASLKVISLRPTDYYQMDTNNITDKGTFSWSMNVIQSLERPMRPHHLAALACSSGCEANSKEKRILNPVKFGEKQQVGNADSAVVFIMADVELKSLTATLTIEGQEDPILDNIPVGGSFLPARRAQRIIVEGLQGQVAQLNLMAETHSGRRAVYEANLWPVGKN